MQIYDSFNNQIIILQFMSITARDQLLDRNVQKDLRGQTQLTDFNGKKNSAFINFDKESKDQTTAEPIPLLDIKIKNRLIPTIVAVICSISSFQFGWAFCQISTVPIEDLIEAYHIPVSSGNASSILVGILPVGAIFGSVLNDVLLKLFSRRHAFYFVIISDLISFILIEINTFETIVIARFLLGIVCGFYTALGPLLIRQISPKAMKALLGSFFSLGRSVGIVSCYLLGVILYSAKCPQFYRIMFAIPALFAIIQGLGIFFLVPNSPIQLIKKERQQQTKEVLSKIYHEDSIDLVYKQLSIQIKLSTSKNENQQQEDPLKKNKIRAFLMSVHLNIYRNFIGINAVVAYAGLIIRSIDVVLAIYAGLIVNGVQLIFVIFSTFYLGSRLGKRFFWLSSGVICGISCIVIGIGQLQGQKIVVLVFILLYMIMFGLLITPVLWSYPAEIIPPSQNGVTVMMTWVALSITAIIPPIIIERMPGNNPYPIFFFFGGYTMISLIYMWFYLVQNRGLTYQQTIQKF